MSEMTIRAVTCETCRGDWEAVAPDAEGREKPECDRCYRGLVPSPEAIEIEAAERFGVWVRLVKEDRLVTISERFPPGRYLLTPALDTDE